MWDYSLVVNKWGRRWYAQLNVSKKNSIVCYCVVVNVTWWRQRISVCKNMRVYRDGFGLNYNFSSNPKVCCFHNFLAGTKIHDNKTIAYEETKQILGIVLIQWLSVSKYQIIIGCECDFTFTCDNGNLGLSKTW